MGTAAPADLVNALRAGHLLEVQQLAEAARLQTFFADAKALAGDLIQRGWLTPFQANLLLQGRGQDLCLGSYVLLERLGEGGMGTVYKARQRSLGRIVAIKVIRKDRVVNPQAVKRFQREIRAAAQLDHPNIVRVFDADEIAGTLLLVMEYVENGTDLSQIVKRDGPLPIATACDYMRQAALGLQHAHERGLVHRDIKPQNLLVVRGPLSVVKNHGPRTTDHGQIKILDMGLALLDHPEDGGKSSASLTGEGTVMGTVDYIAPEQALDSHHVDIRADLYSLGCTFYYLLTARVPFPGGDAVGKLIRQQTEEPEPFELLRPEISPALAAIVRKLMAKRKEERFQTPAELAVALEEAAKHGVESRSQGSEVRSQKSKSSAVSGTAVDPKLARQWAEVVAPSSETEALVKPPVHFPAPAKPLPWRRIVAGSAAALVLLIVLLWQPWRGGEKPDADSNPVTRWKPKPPTSDEVEEKKRQAEEKKRFAEAEEGLKPLTERVAVVAAGPSEAGDKLRKDLREFLMKHFATPAATKACDLLGQVLAKLPSPLDALDSKKLPQDCIDHWRAGGRAPPDELVGVLGEHPQRHWGAVQNVAYSPDGKSIASGSTDGTVCLWDADTMHWRRVLRGQPQGVDSLAFNPKGNTLAAGSRTGGTVVQLWNLTTGTEMQTLNEERAWDLVFSPEGKWLALAIEYGTVKLYETATWTLQKTLKAHTYACYAVTFSRDGTKLATGGTDGTETKDKDDRTSLVKVWDVESSQELVRCVGHKSRIISVAFSGDARSVLACADDNTVRQWEVASGGPLDLTAPRKSGGGVGSMVFSPKGSQAISGSIDGGVRVWAITDWKQIRLLRGHMGPVRSVAFSPGGGHAVSGGADATVRVWDLGTGQEVQPLMGPVGRVRCLAFSPDDGTILAGSGPDYTASDVRLWDMAGGQELSRFKGLTSHVNSVAFSPDGRQVLSGSHDGIVRLWDVKSAKELQRFKGHTGEALSVAFSPDGRRGLSGGGDSTLRLWEVETGNELRRFEGHTNAIYAVAFSPDGRQALSAGSHDKTVRLWEVQTGAEVRRFDTHFSFSVAFSPDGRRVAAGNSGLWNLTTGQLEHELPGHTGMVWSVPFAPDSRTLATAGGDGRITLWDTSGGKRREWQLPGSVRGVAFAHDGRHLATANGNGTVYIFRVADGPPRRLSTAEAKKQQLDAAEHFSVPVEIENSSGMKLNLIPPGRFLMGSPESEPFRKKDESPLHTVTLTKPFYLGIHEVTVGQFQSFIKATGYKTEAEKDGKGALRYNPATQAWEMDPAYSWRNPGWKQTDDHPVVCVSWNDASAFCSWLGKQEGKTYRLPTEAEWEYSCRAGARTVYCFGDDPGKLGEYAWHKGNSRMQTHPVGRLQANAFGLFDMHGNAAEWCADFYEENYYQNSPATDPPGPTMGTQRTGRGGTWSGIRLGGAMRGKNDPTFRGTGVGFRVVCDYRPPQITNSVGMKLARIPAGKFLMGSPDNEPGRDADEGPQHEATISKPFHMGVHEVTVGQFMAFVEATKYRTEAEKSGLGARGLDPETRDWEVDPKFTWRTPGYEQSDLHPVTCVSWNDAVAFCDWLSKKEGKTYRLPTEAEWEYACRAGTRLAFHFGPTLTPQQANYSDSGKNKPVAAGSYPPNDFGLHDMHGNVSEWCADWYATDPKGPTTGTIKVIRGGSWAHGAGDCRAARRDGNAGPSDGHSCLGCRVVCEIQPH